MATLFSSLEIGRKSLYAQQIALQVTGNNIANVNTPNYTRQKVVLTPSFTVPTAAGQLGTGVDVLKIEAVRDQFIEARVQNVTQEQSKQEALSNNLSQVEAVFNIGKQGIQDGITNFFNSWSALSTDPESASLRNSVVTAAKNLTSNVQGSYNQLVDLRQNINKNVIDAVNQINSLASNIAAINVQISLTENTGTGASNLRDERTRLLGQLSGLVDINYYETEDGSFTISTSGGNALVTGGQANPLTTTATAPAGMVQINSGYQDITSSIKGGALAGLLETRDKAIPDYQDRLDTLAQSLITQVNTVHAAGTNLQIPPGTNLNFFAPTVVGSSPARYFSLDNAILADSKNIAAAQSTSPGDNANSIAIADLANQKLLSGNTETFSQYYGSLQFAIGNDSKTAQLANDTQSSLLTQLQNQRDSASAVSLDEEAIDMMKYQRAYQASSRFISVIDQLTAQLLSSFGTSA
jgi:flagellar hook-associated protein 1 FlgK